MRRSRLKSKLFNLHFTQSQGNVEHFLDSKSFFEEGKNYLGSILQQQYLVHGGIQKKAR